MVIVSLKPEKTSVKFSVYFLVKRIMCPDYRKLKKPS